MIEKESQYEEHKMDSNSHPFVCKLCGRTTENTTLVCLDHDTDFFVCKEGFGCMDKKNLVKYHSEPFLKIYNDLLTKGRYVSPRGQKVLEIENYSFTLWPYVRFTNFEARKFNLNYLKEEFLWYLKGDKYDTSITQHASIWKNLIYADGTINSNYGQYIFGARNQFDDVVQTLIDDKDSRRAVIIILKEYHLQPASKDIPCTYSLSFRIRENPTSSVSPNACKLNMSVHMRSQDAVYGMSNDVPTFSFIHEMVYLMLKETYPELQYGEYYHSADSFHVYEKHFEMLNKLVSSHYTVIDCPQINSAKEVVFLRNIAAARNSFGLTIDIPEEYKFTKWLFDRN